MSSTFSLGTIADNHGARKKPRSIGRGIGSGRGKTSKRGGKGQTARSGSSINGFEGGQTPIYRRLPKRGFVNIHASSVKEITFKDLEFLCNKHKEIFTSQVIDLELLKSFGYAKSYNQELVLLNKGVPSHSYSIAVTRATKNSIMVAKEHNIKLEII